MGKEGYFAGRSSKRGVVVGGGGRRNDAETQVPSGCMCAVFQFFDFHPFHFPNINQQQPSFKPPSCTLEDHTTVSKGILSSHCSCFKPPTTFLFSFSHVGCVIQVLKHLGTAWNQRMGMVLFHLSHQKKKILKFL